MASGRPTWAVDTIDAGDDEKPARGRRIMTGTDVRRETSKDGEEHRRCTVSDVYIACDDGDTQGQTPWFCLQTQHFGVVKKEEWQPGWEHRFRWYSMKDFLQRWPKMEERLNLVVLVDGKPWVAKFESDGTLKEEVLRGLAVSDEARQPPRG